MCPMTLPAVSRQMSCTSSSMGDVESDHGSKVVNYEDTVRQLDLYYGVGNLVKIVIDLLGLCSFKEIDNRIR